MLFWPVAVSVPDDDGGRVPVDKDAEILSFDHAYGSERLLPGLVHATARE